MLAIKEELSLERITVNGKTEKAIIEVKEVSKNRFTVRVRYRNEWLGSPLKMNEESKIRLVKRLYDYYSKK